MTHVKLRQLGTAKRIDYVRNNRRYTHEFDAGTELGFYAAAGALVIAPVTIDARGWNANSKARATRKRAAKKQARRKVAKRTTARRKKR